MKLAICTKKIDISIQEIDKFYLHTFEMLITDYIIKGYLQKI